MLNIVPTTAEHVEEVALRMRSIDQVELRLALGDTPENGLRFIFAKATKCWTILADGAPVVIFGYNVTDLLHKVASPFMVATKEAEGMPRVLGRVSRAMLDRFSGYYLVNYVNIQNTLAIRWLEWLGFYLAEPQLYADAVMVRRFSKDCR